MTLQSTASSGNPLKLSEIRGEFATYSVQSYSTGGQITSFTVPVGTNILIVEVWGAGGGGSKGINGGNKGNAGGSGAYTRSEYYFNPATSGATVSVTVGFEGSGATADSSPGTAGGSTSATVLGLFSITAGGGGGAQATTAGTTGGAAGTVTAAGNAASSSGIVGGSGGPTFAGSSSAVSSNVQAFTQAGGYGGYGGTYVSGAFPGNGSNGNPGYILIWYATAPSNLRSYLRAGGLIASNGANTNIATSGTLNVLSYLSGAAYYQTSFTAGTVAPFATGYRSTTPTAGTLLGSDTMGASKSSTATFTLTACYSNPFVDLGLMGTVNASTTLQLSGTTGNSGWTSVEIKGTQLQRTSAVYSAGTWSWDGYDLGITVGETVNVIISI